VEKKIKICLDASQELNRQFSLPVRKPADIPVPLSAGIKMLTLSSESSLLALGAASFFEHLKK